MKREISVFVFLLFAVHYSLFAASNTGASFLNIGTSARVVSMGNAYVGMSDDVSAISYNPAGLAILNRDEIAAQHTEWLSDIKHDFIAGAFPLKSAIVGFGAIYLSQGALEGRDENRANTASFGASDLAVMFSYGRRVNSAVSVGVNLKLIHQSIEKESASGVAFDMGALYRLDGSPLSVGLAVRNLGPQMKFISEGYDLPLSISAGGGYNIGRLTLSATIKQQVYEGKTSVSFGTEYLPVQAIALRAGYLLPVIASDVGAQHLDKNLSDNIMGLGMGIGLNILGFRTDYAFTPYGDLGTTHRISFSMKF